MSVQEDRRWLWALQQASPYLSSPNKLLPHLFPLHSGLVATLLHGVYPMGPIGPRELLNEQYNRRTCYHHPRDNLLLSNCVSQRTACNRQYMIKRCWEITDDISLVVSAETDLGIDH